MSVNSPQSPQKTGQLEPLQRERESPSGWAQRDQAFTPIFDDGTSSDPFTSFPDYSKINTGRHSASRCDTFSTPTRLGKRQETVTPAKMDMKSCDLLWLCEQCFRKEVSGLGNQILRVMRGEFQDAMSSLHQQVTDIVDTKMQTIIQKTDKIQIEVEAPVKIDFEPVHNQVDDHKDQTRQLESRLSSNIAQVMAEINTVRQQHQESERGLRSQVKGLHSDIEVSVKDQVQQIFKMQESMKAEFSQALTDIKHMQADNRKVCNDLVTVLRAQLSQYFEEQTVNVDFTQVTRQLANSQQSANADFHRVLNELQNLEDTVGTNVVKMLDEHFERIGMQLTEIQEMEAAAKDYLHRATEDNGVQTDVASRNEMWTQTDEKLHKKQRGPNQKKLDSQVIEVMEHRKKGNTELKNKGGFADAEAMKEKVRAALIKPQYNVQDYYKTKGIVQKIAKSNLFENLTFVVIFVNAIWIAVDTDNNGAAMLIDAHPVFQVAENLFCFYFTAELLIRFLAFKKKAHCRHDMWFVFDFLLVSLMVLETWVMTVVLLAMGSQGSANVGDASILRMVRMVKMIRLSRMARLLRAIPELVVLLKAVGAAARIILVFLLLWSILIYVFAVLFRQVSDGQAIGNMYFNSVPDAMNTLLLDGILPGNAALLNNVGGASPVFYPIMMVFILISAVTLMYMLIGVLGNVIGVVANAEKEAMAVQSLACQMRRAFDDLGYPTDSALPREEFEKLIVEPDIIGTLQDASVDVVVLVDMSGLLYEDAEKNGGMKFEYFVEMALKMRGSNPATVQDVKQQLRVIQFLVKESVDQIQTHMSTELSKVHKEIHELHESSSSESWCVGGGVESSETGSTPGEGLLQLRNNAIS